MGVPKFYRWISERYPQINQIISDNTLIPEIDNLYLDMNGILHACSHPNDDDPSAKALTFKEMIQNIFSYIDRIVSEIVKPKKVLLMVIDGVAPRAKLNQQRSRRFRAAQDRVENMEKLRAKGERVDEESAFDSNCITPGTDFMDQVSKHLKWFIRKKIKEDLLWRNLEIVFSGHDVPGEGEHKIMQYLREKRAMPNYQPNIRHCMYGQDADLIMLGLATHEPHFALVREVVNFNSFKKGASARQTVMRNTKEAQFQLLHLSILREYIESDFGLGIEETETFKIDKERLVDDFIFLTFFVGNDFLPHLPTLDISENAFDVVFNAYKFVVSKTHSYFVQNGEIADFDQIETFCQIIGKQEQEILSTRESEDKRTLAKRSKYRDFKPQHTQNELDEMEESLQTHYESAVVESSLAKLTVVQASAQVKVRNNIYSHLVENYFNEDGGDDEDFDYDPDAETEAEVGTGGVGDYEDNQLNVGEENDSDNVEGFVTVSKNKDKGKSAPPTTTAPAKKFAGKDYRGRYYFDKFKQLPSDSSDATLNDDFLKELIAHYLEGLIWCVAYYMKGCISWTWYYPYHYGPMLQDMKNLKQVAQTIDFKLGTPFLPFQQLLGCLPPASKKLLPAAYQWIMTSADSPCFQFYPKDFAIDMTHKKNPWEAVVLLPFIDEKVLLATEIQYCNQNLLTAQEKVRNSFGTTHVHTYNPNVTETYFSNSVDQGFSDIMCCQSSVQQVETSLAPGEFFQSKLIEGTKPFLPGFPTLTSLRLLKVELSAVQVNVFGSESKYKSLLVEVDSMREKIEQQLVELQSSDTAVKTSSEKKFMALLGKSVYVNYPQLHEAKIVAVTTEGKEIRADFNHASNSVSNPRVIPYDHITSQKWAKDSMEEQSRYFKGRGSPGSGGLIIGQVLIRLRVVALQGMKTDLVTGERRKVFGRSETDIPIQLVLWNHLHDPRFVETDKLPLTSLFPNRCEVVGIKGDCLGIKGYVVHTDGKADNGDDLKGTATSRQSLQQEHAQGKKKASTTSGPDMRLVDVEFLVPDSVEPQFGHVIAKSMQEPYVSSKEVCKILNISPDLLGKIVGSIAADPGRHDLGLNLKRNGQHQLLGYVRRVENGYSSSASAEKSTVPNVWKQADKVKLVGSVEPSVPAVTEQVSAQWEYTIQATELLADYKAKFPMLFQNLARLPHKPKYMLSELLGKDAEKTLDSIMEWMKGQISFHLPRTLLTTSALPK